MGGWSVQNGMDQFERIQNIDILGGKIWNFILEYRNENSDSLLSTEGTGKISQPF